MKKEVNVAATKRRASVQKSTPKKNKVSKKLKPLDSGEIAKQEPDILDDTPVDDEDEREEDKDPEENGHGDVSDPENDVPEISGWADSMARILHSTKPKHKKVLILSRAKKDYEINRTNQDEKVKKRVVDDLEIDGEEPTEETAVEEPKDKEPSLSLKTQRKLELKQKRMEKQWENLSRKKANDADVLVEKALTKIATKGVVQLFNAVAMQQKNIKGKLRTVRNSEFKKDKVLSQTKDIFDSALKKSRDRESGIDEIEIKEESDEETTSKKGIRKKKLTRKSDESTLKKPAWKALQDDFMLDTKMKDWDRSSDSDN